MNASRAGRKAEGSRRPSGMPALMVLERLVDATMGMTTTELARDLDVDPAQIHRAMKGLLDSGYTERDPITQRFRATPQILALASRLLASTDVVSIARPHMSSLREETGETVHVAQRIPEGAICVARLLSAQPVAATTAVGERFDNPASAVRMALSSPDSAHADGWPYVVDRGQGRPGVWCVAAPIRDMERRIVAVIAVSGPQDRIDEGRLATFGGSVARTAAAISTALGFRDSSAVASAADERR